MSIKDNRISIYAIGGCGINITLPLLKVAAKDEKGYANMTFGMVDTSHSNLPDGGFESSFIHVGNRRGLTDGSGKIRATNADIARQAVPDILSRWEPGDLNIVIHSGSGGSGSLVGNLLTKELISMSKNVIVIMVGSRTSIKEVDNVRDTILTYQKVAEGYSRPVPCFYLDNTVNGMSGTDDRARVMILFLSAVWSGENRGLDRKDLENFLNYQNVTDYPPAIVSLEMVSGSTALESTNENPITTVVTIVKPGEDHSPGIMVPYHSYGELDDKLGERLKLITPVHLFTRQGVFPEILNDLERDVAEHRAPRKVSQVVVDRDTGEDFLVL